MRLAPGTSPVPVVWSWADPGASVLGHPTPFHSAVHDSYITPDPQGLGEVKRFYEPTDTRLLPALPGRCHTGTAAQWRNGLTAAELAGPPTPRPRCCMSFGDHGGIAGGGLSTWTGRPASELLSPVGLPLGRFLLLLRRRLPVRVPHLRPFPFPVPPFAPGEWVVPRLQQRLPRRHLREVHRPLPVLRPPAVPSVDPMPLARRPALARRQVLPRKHLGTNRFPFPVAEVVRGERPIPLLRQVFPEHARKVGRMPHVVHEPEESDVVFTVCSGAHPMPRTLYLATADCCGGLVDEPLIWTEAMDGNYWLSAERTCSGHTCQFRFLCDPMLQQWVFRIYTDGVYVGQGTGSGASYDPFSVGIGYGVSNASCCNVIGSVTVYQLP